MTSRGKHMVNMVCQKDQMRLKQLEMKIPKWDTTEGVNLIDIDINTLKHVIFEPISKQTGPSHVVDFQNDQTNIENKSINEKIVSTDSLHKNIVTKDIIIHSNVIIPSIELQPAESYNNFVTSDDQPTMVAGQSYLKNLQSAGTSHSNFDLNYNMNTTFQPNNDNCNSMAIVELTNARPDEVTITDLTNVFPIPDNDNYNSMVISELTNARPDEVTITDLTNVFPIPDNSINYYSENDSFNDSESEYVPESVSSAETSSEFSSDSNHSNTENSKGWAESNEFEQTQKTNADSQEKLRQDERNNELNH